MISGVLRRRGPAVAFVLAIAVCAASLVAYAISLLGYPVHHAELNDGGVWVSNNSAGYLGRMNKPVSQFDGGLFSPGGETSGFDTDLVQSGSTLIAWDKAGGKLVPVDTSSLKIHASDGVKLPDDAQVSLNGGVLAVLNPASGQLWAAEVTGQAGSLSAIDSTATPLAKKIGAGSVLTVSADGTIFAASAATGLTTIRHTAAGFGKPEVTALTPTPTGKLAITAVGEKPVLLGDNTLFVPGAGTVNLPGAGPVLQQPGPATADVLVQTSTTLFSVSLAKPTATTLVTAPANGPAANPVQLGGCRFAAWAGSPGQLVKYCGPGSPAAVPINKPTQSLVFRVNRGQLLLNDTGTGAVFNVDSGTPRQIDNWSSVIQSTKPATNSQHQNQDLAGATKPQPPKVKPDLLGARAGRTTALYVLDNDSDPTGNILSIQSVTGLSDPKANLSIAPDGQTVDITLPKDAQGSTTFNYVVGDGSNPTATAQVVVNAVPADQLSAPTVRLGYTDRTWHVPAGGQISLPVLSEWRNYANGDPPVLRGVASPSTADGVAATSADGQLLYNAPATPGARTLIYTVGDGAGPSSTRKLNITVQSPTESISYPAIAEPDFAHGQVGSPIVVDPLANDLPGSDPRNPTATLSLAGKLAAPSGTTVTTDLSNGTVSVIAKRPGNYVLSYLAAYGNARYATGKIRINAIAATAGQKPITAPVSAVLFGQQPATVDVLASDYDPSGRLLAVQNASGGDQLQVAVLAGRWLRINALTPDLSPGTEVVSYSVSNGVSGPVTGQVVVNQLPLPTDSAPVTTPDYATVRAGDSVTIPVLDNDVSPTGAELSLRQSQPGGPKPGALTVTPSKGMAFVSGNVVRYVAPPAASVTDPTEVTIDYVAQDAAGHAARGQATVTVNPLPSQANPDQAPEPQPVEARVVAGDTTTIQVPVSGVDPDGDTVTVTGIGSPPTLGRITTIGATTITYQAFPAVSNGGTDTIEYRVDDGHGQTGSSTIRIAVVPPSLPQPPVAEDIALSIGPGSQVSVDAMAHVLSSPDDKVTISPLKTVNPGSVPGAAKLAGPQGPIILTANGLTGKPVVLRYQVSDGASTSVGTITVRSEAGAVLPPVAHDQYAKPSATATSVDVDVLKNAYDPTGGRLHISYPAGFSGSTITVKTSKNPQIVPYVLASSSGATATAVIFVPAVGGGVPRLKVTTPIQLGVNATRTIDINQYVEDPTPGKKLRLTTRDRAWAAPGSSVRVKETGTTSLAITTSNGYQGPGAITFEVTDGATAGGDGGVLAVLSVPAQVGSPTPVLRCPAESISLVEGGAPVGINPASVCHVWTANPGDAAGLHYTGKWKRDPGAVTVQDGGPAITLTAQGAAKPGSTGTLTVGVQGSSALPSTLSVQVNQAPSPSVAPITVDGIKANETKTVDVTGFVTSALRDPKISVVGTPTRTAGDPATIAASGSTIRITPGKDSHGSITFSFVISDVADTSRGDRHAIGQIKLDVLGHPDAPSAPVPGRTVQSRSVLLSWAAPADNGAPITYYEVDYGSGKQRCPASPCNITALKNGQTYTFSVTAYNLVGPGPASSRSTGARPDKVPDAVTNFVASNPQDHAIQLTWTPAHVDGTPVSHYSITWGNGGSATVGAVTSYQPTGLTNDSQYTFTIQAQNDQGFGAKASIAGQSAGKPLPNPPAAPTFTAVTDADGKSRDVQVNWTNTPDDPNGKGPTTYTVQRTDNHGGSKTLCPGTPRTSCTDSGLNNDGTVYTYSVQAANYAAIAAPTAHTTAFSAGARMEATATPDPVVINSVSPTGNDGEATINFDAPASHGASSTISCTANGSPCGSWSSTFPVDGQSGVSRTITGLSNGTATTITLQDCNGSEASSDTYSGQPCDGAVPSSPMTPYGPIQGLQISSQVNGTQVTWIVTIDARGKPVNMHVTTNHGTDSTYTTSSGTYSNTFVDNAGYSATDNLHVDVSDTAGNPVRPGQSGNGSATTPPPPPQVIVSKGGSCSGSSCSSLHPTACTGSACAFIHVQTKNFGGSVTCTFNSSNGNGGFVNETYGANDSKDSYDYFGYQGGWVEATCGGVGSGHYTW